MKEIGEEGPQGGTVTLHRVRWGGAGFDQWRDVTSLADASSSEKRTNCRDEARSKGTSEPGLLWGREGKAQTEWEPRVDSVRLADSIWGVSRGDT